jgi:hypothetical protein
MKKTNYSKCEDAGKKEPNTLLVGTEISAAAMEISVEVSQKTKSRYHYDPVYHS